jgi:hypothetical protein
MIKNSKKNLKKFLEEKKTLFLFLGLCEGLSSYRRSLQNPRRDHPPLRNMDFPPFFLFL